MKTVDRTVWDVIDARKDDPGSTEDLLGLLLTVRDGNGDPLPLKRVRDEATTFMLAGHETTANALAWMQDGAGAPERAALRDNIPAPVLALVSTLFGRRYRREIAPIWR